MYTVVRSKVTPPDWERTGTFHSLWINKKLCVAEMLGRMFSNLLPTGWLGSLSRFQSGWLNDMLILHVGLLTSHKCVRSQLTLFVGSPGDMGQLRMNFMKTVKPKKCCVKEQLNVLQRFSSSKQICLKPTTWLYISSGGFAVSGVATIYRKVQFLGQFWLGLNRTGQ